jgi:uncharacterized protein (TIGR03437 family)
MSVTRTIACSVVLAIGAVAVRAQTAPVPSAAAPLAVTWTRVAGTTVNLGLAGPSAGPVRSVWYAAAGRLLVQTESGRVFETSDFQHWRLNSSPEAATPRPAALTAQTRPELGLRIATSSPRRYSVTRNNVYASEDGRAWINLTGLNNRSIIGDGFTGLAVSPANPLDIAAANQFGVWRSLDGGLSWQSLNDDLPNMPARRLIGPRTVTLDEASAAGFAMASVTAGKWTPVDGTTPESVLIGLAARKGLPAISAAQSGSMIYEGTAAGSLLISTDGGETWADSSLAPVGATERSGPVERIWADPVNPAAALAVSGASLFRTTNGGKFWDNVTGELNAGRINGIAADSTAGVVYAATDRGLFSGRLSLNAANQAVAVWVSVSGDLPFVAASDIRLNIDATLTVLMDGYGVFEAPAPHRLQAPRIVNAADLSDRAAAPGSLISVLGANVKQARSGQNLYPVLFPSSLSSQLQVPFEVTPGTLQLAVEGEGGIWVAPLNVKDAAPAIFVDADGSPVLQDASTGLAIDPTTPLHPGAVVQVLATGLGRVSPDWPTGVAAPVDSPPVVRAPVSAFLDGRPVKVTRAILAPTFIGNYLVELEIPSLVNRGAGELRIVVNGEESNRVRLYLEPDIAAQ